MPDFVEREVTDDPRYSGGCVIKEGISTDIYGGKESVPFDYFE